MMLTIFSPLERVLPTIPHPIQGQYDFYHYSSVAGSFSITYHVQNPQRRKHINKIYIQEKSFFSLKPSKQSQLIASQSIVRNITHLSPNLTSN